MDEFNKALDELHVATILLGSDRIRGATKERQMEARARVVALYEASIRSEAKQFARNIVREGTLHELRMMVDDNAERLFWEFDQQRKQTGAERDAFKAAIRKVYAALEQPK